MDPIITQIITSLATSYFAQFTAPIVEKFFRTAFKLKPDLENRLRSVQTTKDIEHIFREAVGVIDAHAGVGSIEVDSTLLEAIRGIRFNHANGLVTISGSTISAPVLVTGGGVGAKGQTNISGTELTSKGTSIKVGKNASIKITGNAKIIQS
jgi:hypothetical protein